MAMMRRGLLNPNLKVKWQQARAAVLSPMELQAVLNVAEPGFFRRKQNAYSDPQIEQHQRQRQLPPPWVQKVIDREGENTWGYIIYTTPDVDQVERQKETTSIWEGFREEWAWRIDNLPIIGNWVEEIRNSKIVEFVHMDREHSDLSSLRKDFRSRRDQDGLIPGVLSNVFLWLPPECRDSCKDRDLPYPWLWAVDPDWALPGADEDGYDGRVRVAWGIAYDRLYNFLSMNEWSLKDIWKDFNQVAQETPEMPTPGWGVTRLNKLTWPDL